MVENREEMGLLRLPLPVDTHVHLSLGGDAYENARCHLDAGVSVVRDAGDRDGLLGGFAWPAGFTVIRTGPAIFRKGCYGSFLGDNRELDLPGKISAAPSVFVKVILTGLVSFDEYSRVGPRQWNLDELTEIVGLARASGKKVMVHANSDAACRDAVLAGVHSIEHGYFIGTETLEMMAEREVFWTPTVAAMANQIHDPEERFSRAQIRIIERNYKRHLEFMARAWELGVKLTIGTDSGSYNVAHGRAYLRELELFQEAGIAPDEVMRIAALNGRRLLGLDTSPVLSFDRSDSPVSLMMKARRYIVEN
jgi:hypothetical protein